MLEASKRGLHGWWHPLDFYDLYGPLVCEKCSELLKETARAFASFGEQVQAGDENRTEEQAISQEIETETDLTMPIEVARAELPSLQSTSLVMESGSPDSDLISKWKLARSAIEHENTLKSHRATWFLTTQLSLFAVFATLFIKFVENNNNLRAIRFIAPLFLVCAIGMYTSILAWANIRAAAKTIKRIHDWWLQYYCPSQDPDLSKTWIESVKLGKEEDRFPPISGIFTKNLYILLDETKPPLATAVTWLMLFLFTSITFISSRFNQRPIYAVLIVYFLLLILYLLLKIILVPWLRMENHGAEKALLDFRINENNPSISVPLTPPTPPPTPPLDPPPALSPPPHHQPPEL
jgi:hypothetical protein